METWSFLRLFRILGKVNCQLPITNCQMPNEKSFRALPIGNWQLVIGNWQLFFIILGSVLTLLLGQPILAQPPFPYPSPLASLPSPLAQMPLPLRGPWPFPGQVAQPKPALPPLLYVRFTGPEGLKITFYRNGPKGQAYDVPVTVGMRPGYRYRLHVSGMADFPEITLAPTLEARGSLLLVNRGQAADYPVGLFFSAEDFASVKAGALVTKVVTLERPETAIPVAGRADRPFQIEVPAGQDPMAQAQAHGRPVLVVFLGPRQASLQELAAQTVPGTLLLPGETALGPPAFWPQIPFACIPPHDPLLGPRDPGEETKLLDGGDRGLTVGFGPTGKLVGLDPADTVAEYVDSKGRKHLAVSNRVGLHVPRFLVVRGETYLDGKQAVRGTAAAQSQWVGEVVAAAPQPVHGQHQNLQIERLQGRHRPSGTASSQGTAVTGRIDGLDVTAVVRPTVSQLIGTSQPQEPPEPLDGPLKLDKWPDKKGGVLGDIITFILRYTNTGQQPITDVAVSDSLVSRFEYIAGSAKTDREALFTTQPNDAGSLTLRWEFPGVLAPGQSGMVSFQVRIR